MSIMYLGLLRRNYRVSWLVAALSMHLMACSGPTVQTPPAEPTVTATPPNVALQQTVVAQETMIARLQETQLPTAAPKVPAATSAPKVPVATSAPAQQGATVTAPELAKRSALKYWLSALGYETSGGSAIFRARPSYSLKPELAKTLPLDDVVKATAVDAIYAVVYWNYDRGEQTPLLQGQAEITQIRLETRPASTQLTSADRANGYTFAASFVIWPAYRVHYAYSRDRTFAPLNRPFSQWMDGSSVIVDVKCRNVECEPISLSTSRVFDRELNVTLYDIVHAGSKSCGEPWSAPHCYQDPRQ